jgi:hypothetical protein
MMDTVKAASKHHSVSLKTKMQRKTMVGGLRIQNVGERI